MRLSLPTAAFVSLATLGPLAARASEAPDELEQRASGPHARMAALHAGEPDAAWTDAPAPLAGSVAQLAPAGTTPQISARVYGYLPYFSSIGAGFRWDLITDLVIFDADLKPDGTVSSWHGWPQTALIQQAHAAGVRVHLCAVLFNSSSPGGEIAAFLASPSARSAAISTLAAAVKSAGAEGLNYDFEFVPTSSKDAFSQFVEDTHAALKAALPNAELTLATPSSVGYHGYDFARLAAATERILIMAYDYHWTSAPNTGPVAPLTAGTFWNGSVSHDVSGVLGVAPPAKLAMGVPYYGNDWPAASDQRNAATTGTAKAVLAKSAIPNSATYGRSWDADSQTPWYHYQTSVGVVHQGWYDDAESLTAKYQFVKSKSLSGIMIWALGYDNGRTELWDALQAQFGATSTPPGPGSLSITQVQFSPAQVQAGGQLTVTFTVKNVGGQTVSPTAPLPGTVYDESQQATGPVAGSLRLAVDAADRPAAMLDHPWRWGLDAPLNPGASTTVSGKITLRTPGARTFWGAVVVEGTGPLQDDVGSTQIVVVGPDGGTGADAGSGADGGASSDAGSGSDAGHHDDAGSGADGGPGGHDAGPGGGDGGLDGGPTTEVIPTHGCGAADAPGLALLLALAWASRRRRA